MICIGIIGWCFLNKFKKISIHAPLSISWIFNNLGGDKASVRDYYAIGFTNFLKFIRSKEHPIICDQSDRDPKRCNDIF